MSMESHLAELERRHAELERRLSEVMARPAADAIEVSDLKRRKLQLKDEIARIRSAATVR